MNKEKVLILNIVKRVLLILFFLNATIVFAGNKDYSSFNVEDFAEKNNEYWTDICSGEEYEECEEPVLKEQLSYYERLYKILGKYQKQGINIDDNLIILTTFYDLTPSSFGEDSTEYEKVYSSSPFSLDKYEIEVPTSDTFTEYFKKYLKEERDSLDKLVNNLFSYNASCYQTTALETTKSESSVELAVCPDGFTPTVVKGERKCAEKLKSYELTFSEHFLGESLLSFLSGKQKDYKKECESLESDYTIEYDLSDGKELNEDSYYSSLVESDYFDNKHHLSSYFSKVLRKVNNIRLENDEKPATLLSELSNTEYEEYYEDILEIKKDITSNIKELVESERQYRPKPTYEPVDSDAYWWPIGSEEITEDGDRLFAAGDPIAARLTSKFGYRIHPISGVRRLHAGIDIAHNEGTQIIAAQSGVVERVITNCQVGPKDCGSGWGNHVKITHSDGNSTIYAHMRYQGVAVKAGDSVDRGQVIGYMGDTGNSKGNHLHFEVRVGNDPVDPLNYVSQENPRPVGSVANDGIIGMIQCFEGGAKYIEGDKYRVYWDLGTHGTLTVGEGVTPQNYPSKFKKRGIDIKDIMYDGALVDRKIVDEIYREIMDDTFKSVEKKLSENNISLNKEKVDALVSRYYNMGNINSFPAAYNKYGNTDALYNNHMSKPVTAVGGGGKVLQGLVKRREAEWKLFHNGVYHTCK